MNATPNKNNTNNSIYCNSTTEIALKYRDSSTECGICLSPFDESGGVDVENNMKSMPAIELDCGHKWHLECLREQLAHAQPNNRCCQCAKCGAVFCNHPALLDVSRRTHPNALQGHGLSFENNNNTNEVCDTCGTCSLSLNQTMPPTHHSFPPPSPRNLLVNPSGKQGVAGWRCLNGVESWQVEDSAVPVSKDVSTNFVSSHFWCTMEQTVELNNNETSDENNNTTNIDSTPSSSSSIEVSAKYMGNEECPSVFRLQAEILNAAGMNVQKMSTGILSAPTDFWEQASLVFTKPAPGAHSVKITIHGKDSLLWRGQYGSKVTDCSVRVLGNGEHNSSYSQ